MYNLVLLSKALHPVSGKLTCNPSELAAWQLSQMLDENKDAVHVGHQDSMQPYLGYGINKIKVIDNLLEYINENPVDVIFTGCKAQGGLDTGMFPYVLSEQLNIPLIASVLQVSKGEDGVKVLQDLGKGRCRTLSIATPVIITASQGLRANLAYSHRNILQAKIETISSTKEDVINDLQDRQFSYKKISIKSNQSGHQRLQNSIETKDAGGDVIYDKDITHKAETLVQYLRQTGINI